jgi:hypothetical protein
MMKSYEQFIAELDRLDVATVRERVETKVYLGGEADMARAWLARVSEAASAEQLALARAAAREASTANTLAKIALAIAVISMIVAIVGVIAPHWWP